MKYAGKLNIPITATSLSALTGRANLKDENIILQAPASNANSVFFGTHAHQPAFILPGGAASLEDVNAPDTYVVGTSGDEIIVLVY